jgi:hypothetical protein
VLAGLGVLDLKVVWALQGSQAFPEYRAVASQDFRAARVFRASLEFQVRRVSPVSPVSPVSQAFPEYRAVASQDFRATRVFRASLEYPVGVSRDFRAPRVFPGFEQWRNSL